MFQGGDRTTHSPTDMDSCNKSPSSFPQTTPRPGTCVRRNLLQDFESEIPSPIAVKTPLTQNTITDRGTCNVTKPESSWYSGMMNWILGFSALVFTVSGIFHYFPTRMNEEVLMKVIILSLVAIVFAFLWKIYQFIPKRTGRITSTMRDTEGDLNQEARNYDQEIGLLESGLNLQVKRTFKGEGSEVWSEFVRYFENIAALNNWSIERRRRILITTFRGQAEAFAYGLPDSILQDYNQLKLQMDNRFGYTAMKETYIVEAKMRRKLATESFRDFGQAIADLYRRAHPGNHDYVEEASLKTFMDNCNPNEDFRLAVKRTRPKNLQEAVTAAMQEECIRMTENKDVKNRENHPVRHVYRVNELSISAKNPNTENRSYTNTELEGKRKTLKKCYGCNSSTHLYKFCPKRKNVDGESSQKSLNVRVSRQ